MYDQTGSTDSQNFGNEDFFRGFDGFRSAGFDESIFANFAEMFGGGGGRRSHARPSGQHVAINIDIDFFESVNGTNKV